MPATAPTDSRLPSGTVTFLFTDIEGSTRLWERFPEEMGAALARHDTLLREAIERNDGAVFKTVGDAFCAAFPTAPRALDAARGAQRALMQEPWPETLCIKVRMALHTGAAEVRDHDYFGQPLNRVARLLAAGHGGQVLLSLACQELVRDNLPPGVTLRDMGERRLRDLIRPERVYQLVAAELPSEFPPLKSLDARAHNLPVQATSFVGREREMQEVKALLQSSRLACLTGAGGAGKTRLALQVAADRIDDFADGVWLVELAPVADGRVVTQSVATVLGVKEEPGVPLSATLTRDLANKELLLVLDNCEHLVQASARLCQTLLDDCAGVRILATSREPLRIPGETTYRVPSLAVPALDRHPDVPAMTQFAAVRLFIDRALAVQPAFAVNNANAPAVASICHHLDGIPLAIELAAARVRSRSVEEVNARLEQRFRLLTGGSRLALPRQQTLRSTIDWSYDLLNATEQALFRRLATFSGGWTLGAASEVCGNGETDESGMVDLLTSLADKSLVVAEEHHAKTRYHLLETLREYARERLRESGEEASWHRRHLMHFVALAEAAEPKLSGADQRTWLDLLASEHDNLRAALAWSCGNGHATAGLRLAGALVHFWHLRGHLGEGRDWLARVLAKTTDDGGAQVRAKALNAAGALAIEQSDYPNARAFLEESLVIARRADDRPGIAKALNNLGNLADMLGDVASARAKHEQSLAIRRELGDRPGIAMSLSNLGLLALDRGEHEAAWALYEECLATHRELGDAWRTAVCLNNMGHVALARSDGASARMLFEESMAIARELGDSQGIALSLTSLANLRVAEGDPLGARTLYVESLAILGMLGDQRHLAWTLEGLADVALATAGPVDAARIWGKADRMRSDIGITQPDDERSRHDRQVAAARAALADDEAFDRAWQEGGTLTLEQATELASDRAIGP